MYRRNSVIARNECCSDQPVSTVIHINGRYPHSGKRSNCKNDALVYVMKGSGMIAHGASKSGLSAGSVVHLKRCKPYYLKGQFSLYLMSI